MNWRVVIRPEVEQDVVEAAIWYESRQPGLGVEFVEEVIRVWDALAENPLSTPVAIRARTFAGVTRIAFLIASFTKWSRPGKR